MAYLRRQQATLKEQTLDSPVLTTPALGTPSAGVVTSLSGVLPVGVTGGSGLTALGTVATGNIADVDIVFPDGHICKITTGSHEGTHTFTTHALDYNEDMTLNNTDKPFSIDHTVLTTDPNFHCFASMPMGGSSYGGDALVHTGIFGDDVFMTSSRVHFSGMYTRMIMVTMNQVFTGAKAAASNFELSIRTAASNIFNAQHGPNGKIYGIGHTGFDTSQNHAAQLMVMEEIS